ncbi:spore germination protein [Clostridium sp. JNZ X4-2]
MGNIFKKLTSLITYKNKKEVQSFYIPEVNESSGNTDYGYDSLSIKNGSKQNNHDKIQVDIDSNIKFIQQEFHYPVNRDIVIRKIKIAGKYNAFIAYLNGAVDNNLVNNFILRPLLNYKVGNKCGEDDNLYTDEKQEEINFILNNVVEINGMKVVNKFKDVIYQIISGNTAMYIDGCNYYGAYSTKGFQKREVTTPQTEGSVKGSYEAFTEDLSTNVTLIRKLIRNKDLITEKLRVGDSNNNECAIMYIDGIINPAIVKEVKRRISSIKTDFISGSGMLGEYIEDNTWSLIPTLLSTERSDRTCYYIMEGRVALISNGTPYVLILPITFFTLFHTSEDYILKWQFGFLLRAVRIFGIIISLLLPGMYVALINYHQEMIPSSLLISIARSREEVPFPTIVEVIFMEISFELIREAGIRIPGILGNTIGIVGALIIGQAAVQASIISPILIIVISFTVLGNYSIPDFSLTYGTRLIRLSFILLGYILGLFGICIGIVSYTAILINLKSFGVPLLSNFPPKTKKSKDTVLNYPVWKQQFRPEELHTMDPKRQPAVSRGWINEDANVEKNDKNQNV